VSAVIDQRHVGITSRTGEVNRLLLHTDVVQIESDDRFEADTLQRFCNVSRVISWIVQRGLFTARRLSVRAAVPKIERSSNLKWDVIVDLLVLLSSMLIR
jgi:hypothetical protein